jgi:hypothetical protein
MIVNLWTPALRNMRKIQRIGLLFLVFLSFKSWAGMSEYPLNGIDRLQVSLTEVNLVLNPQPGLKNLKLRASDNLDQDLSITQRESSLMIRSKDQLSKSSFAKKTKAKKDLEIIYPQQFPIEAHVLEGNITAQKLTKDTFLHLQKGKILVRDSQASLQLHLNKGELSIIDSGGKIVADMVAAQSNIKNFNGDMELQSFSGDINIDKGKGYVSLNLGTGSAKVVETQGNLQFELQKGFLNVQRLKGRVEGQNQDGSVNVVVGAEGDVSIRSQAGKVSVQTPEGSGAALNLATTEGDIFVPSYLKINRDSNQKSLRGRLKGEMGKSQIFVRSQTGSISVK